MRRAAAILFLAAAPALALPPSAAWWFGRAASRESWALPTDGLVFWHRPGTTLSTNAYYGASHPATLALVTLVAGEGFYDVNDETSYVTIPAPFPSDSDSPFTLSMWVKPSAIDLLQYLFNSAGSGTAGNGPRLYFSTSERLYLSFHSGLANYRGRQTGNDVVSTNWQYVSAVYVGGSVANPANYQIWHNGVRRDAADYSAGSAPSWASVTNALVLRGALGVNAELRGSMDEVCLWLRALSTTNEQVLVMEATRGVK